MNPGDCGLCTAEADLIFASARQIACDLGHEYVGTEHLSVALLRSTDAEVQRKLSACGVSAAFCDSVLQRLESMRIDQRLPASSLPWSPVAKEVICNALRIARGQISSMALLMAWAADIHARSPWICELMTAKGVVVEPILHAAE
ncbi:MAG: hypothetical protein KY476_24015 [Planctomycetes bacterium]|nr:hypothetical protein [Planctomycetota bacterium]